MITPDFTRIRNHDGSQANGFEELICQLAHLNPPVGHEKFVRKDGAGGDGGVECYWVLGDGCEHGWQAKYFTHTLTDAQWAQVNDSVITALKKHPRLSTYYICFARDLSDSRKIGRSGHPVNSAYDTWLSYINKWKAVAEKAGMTVEFVFWGKHEIFQFLQKTTPDVDGRLHYWFNEAVLTSAQFQALIQRSRLALGERFTPSLHVELSVSKILAALGGSEDWYRDADEKVERWRAAVTELSSHVSRFNGYSDSFTEIKSLIENYRRARKSKYLPECAALLNAGLRTYSEKVEGIRATLVPVASSQFDNGQSMLIGRVFNAVQIASRELSAFLQNREFQAAKARSVLITGEAGIGKSHLLCDVAFNRLAEGLPTVFCLAQRYPGGDPIDWLKNEMGLNMLTGQQFLGALSAAAEAINGKALIMIDAINEGHHREDWHGQLSSFISQVMSYSHLALVISCRSNFLEYMIDAASDNLLYKVMHHGFSGSEHRACEIYLTRQGISRPGAPVLAPEFSNPLFLKTCCRALKQQGLNAFPKGMKGINGLFSFYIESVEKLLQRLKRYRHGELDLHSILNGLAVEMFPDNMFGMPVGQVRCYLQGADPNPGYGESLLDLLISEGVLADDVLPDPSGGRPVAVIRFTYERLSDFFIASGLVSQIVPDDITRAFLPGGCFCFTAAQGNLRRYAGMLNMSAIIFAETFGLEFVDFINRNGASEKFALRQLFTDTLVWRSGASFTSRTLHLLSSLEIRASHSAALDILLSLSTEPTHPWNADWLHSILKPMTLAQRDAFWSVHLTASDIVCSENDEGSPLHTLTDWAFFSEPGEAEQERMRLAAITIMWMTSCTSRKVRDQATKSLVRTLVFYPELMSGLYTSFRDVNDAYIRERLYAALYGAVANTDNNSIISGMADEVYDYFFSAGEPDPHLVMRDYARGIIERALSLNCLSQHINITLCRPPFKSAWPLSFLDRDTLKARAENDDKPDSIISSLLGFPGDFGNYGMSAVSYWSPDSINVDIPRTAGEMRKDFILSLGPLTETAFLMPENCGSDIRNSVYDAPLSSSHFESVILRVEEILTDEQKYEFQQIKEMGHDSSVPAFSKLKAQCWVTARALDFGWSDELFGQFEQHYTSRHGREEPKTERVGKKYQRIALQELLAHLADNCKWKGRGLSDGDVRSYSGPWQIFQRDIDPTLLLRGGTVSKYDDRKCHNRLPNFLTARGDTLETLIDWLWDESFTTEIVECLRTTHEAFTGSWFTLGTFIENENEVFPTYDSLTPLRQSAWIRISGIFVRQEDLPGLLADVKNLSLSDPTVFHTPESGHAFLREYPWHPSMQGVSQWQAPRTGLEDVSVSWLSSVVVYSKGVTDKDYSIVENVSMYLPAAEMINTLTLEPACNRSTEWQLNGETVFFDPSEQAGFLSSGQVQEQVLNDFLEKKSLCMVWIIGGEKMLIEDEQYETLGRLSFSAVHWLDGDEINGDVWFHRESLSSESL